MKNADLAEYAQHARKIRLILFLGYLYSNMQPFQTKY